MRRFNSIPSSSTGSAALSAITSTVQLPRRPVFLALSKKCCERMRKKRRSGRSAPSSEIYRNTAVLRNLLGARIRLVSGYGGMPPIKLAMQRGEVNGVCGLTAAALRREYLPDLASGSLKLVLQINGDADLGVRQGSSRTSITRMTPIRRSY